MKEGECYNIQKVMAKGRKDSVTTLVRSTGVAGKPCRHTPLPDGQEFISCTRTLNVWKSRVDHVEHGYQIRSRFARAVLGARKNVTPHEGHGDGFFLHGRWAFKALLVDSHQELAFQCVVGKLVALGGQHIL